MSVEIGISSDVNMTGQPDFMNSETFISLSQLSQFI